MYSVKDSKSLHTQNNDLLNFRKIIGQLSTAPYFENECFRPFNAYIAAENSYYAQKADKAGGKREKEKWNSYIIPQRKGFSPAKWYLAYLAHRGLLSDFEIACYKTGEDRLRYLIDKGVDMDIPAFKLKIKMTTGDEKRSLTKIYKQAKRNFLFKDPGGTAMGYCIKNDNAILRYKRGEVWIQFTASADLLMKWVFADMKFSKGKEIQEKICAALDTQYDALANNNYDNAPLGLPPSLFNSTLSQGIQYDMQKATNKINVRLEKVKAFLALNHARRAPWKFAAKRKMDYIFEYIHLAYTYSAVAENKTIDQRRHDALNDTEYLQAMHYIRFYGRYCNMLEFRDFFFTEKRTYFSSLHGCIDQSQTLEELFNAVAQKLINFYEKKILIKLSDGNLDRFAQVFKLRQPPQPGSAEKHAPLFAVNQVVEHSFIDIAKMAEGSEYYTAWEKTIKDKDRTTDFSLIRHWLANENKFDTNTDYIMKIIMPAVMAKLPKKDNGALRGGTSLFNSLMKNKTDELVLWEVAKYYWQKTYGKAYQTNWHQQLKRGENIKDRPYKKNLFFYQVFSWELLVDLGKDIQVKIKPKKFDDEFQYYENVEMRNYIEQYRPKKNEDGYWHYEELNKNIKDNIAKYLDDAYLMLVVEKQVVRSNYDKLTDILHGWFKDGKAKGYYMEFGTARKNVADDASENTIVTLVYRAINPSGSTYNVKDLVLCRNAIMHQQVQPDKNKYIAIRTDLITYCAANKLLELYKRPVKAQTQ